MSDDLQDNNQDTEIDLEDTLVIDQTEDGPQAEVVPTRLVDQFDPNPTVDADGWPFEKTNKPFAKGTALTMLPLGVEEIDSLFEELGINVNDQTQDLDPKRQRAKEIVLSFKDAIQMGYFRETKKRPDALWQQKVDGPEGPLRAGKVRLRQSDDPVLRIRNALGIGGLVQIPLWHSGIWLTLETPSDQALLELERRISSEKVELGRTSNGMVFSNVEVYTIGHIVDFVMDHVYTTTTQQKDSDTLKRLIRKTDIPLMVWGMLLAIYPKGYPLTQPCLANPETCDHVIEQMINISRLCFVDTTRLTERQKKHMSNRIASYTEEKIKEYQDEFVFPANAVVKLNDVITVKLGVPSIAEAQDSGYSWVDGITGATQKAFGLRMKENERGDYIREQALLTSLRQYSHWIKSVTNSEDGEEVLIDREKIDTTIDYISSNDEMTTALYKAILSYIDGTSIAMIALPRHKCPKCQGEPAAEYMKHPHLIPIDVVYVFFILRVQKLSQKMAAELNRVI